MKDYLKNPFNYQGGKYKILPQIEPYFPETINTFIDVFGGGGEVVLNDTITKKHIYNEKCVEMYSVLYYLKHNPNTFVRDVEDTIELYNLSKTNKEGFNLLRKSYNEDVHNSLDMNYMKTIKFYTLLAHSFNNQFGFNKSHEFNVPFGMNRSSFNAKMKSNLEKYIEHLKYFEIEFSNKDFLELFNTYSFKENDFFYCDPPYLITVGGYERSPELKWNEDNEKNLLIELDKLNANKVKFALSNVLEHKGKENAILKEWAKKYHVIDINKDYSNCNYQTNLRENKSSKEVLILNY